MSEESSVNYEVQVQDQTSVLLPVSRQSVEELQNQRSLLGEFVRSQLKEADFSDERSPAYGQGDYGVIPGTKQKCLFKQGAEKLLRLFGLGVRFKQMDKEIDRHANFALYTYQAEVYAMKTGKVVASSEATTNSQEKKWKERTEWKTNAKNVRESTKVETPIYDILNTLQKMAQKRALIGATLLATGASEYFTQDVLEPEDLAPEGEKEKAPPKQAEATVSDVAPVCCGKSMMISKYADKETGDFPWYCVQCKNKVGRLGAA